MPTFHCKLTSKRGKILFYMSDRLMSLCCIQPARQLYGFLHSCCYSCMAIYHAAAKQNRSNLSSLWLMEIPSLVRVLGGQLSSESEQSSRPCHLWYDPGCSSTAIVIPHFSKEQYVTCKMVCQLGASWDETR